MDGIVPVTDWKMDRQKVSITRRIIMARRKTQTTAKAAAAVVKEAAKAETVKTAAAPAEEAAVKEAPAAEAPAKEAAPAAEKKAEAKKPAKKQEIKTTVSVQYLGKDISDKDMVALVKKQWTASKHKISEIKTLELYVKVEENTVYYVINGTEKGSVEI